MLNQSDKNGGPPQETHKKSPLQEYFDILFEYSFDLIKLNFLFLLACIPLITIPAAITGVSRVVGLIVRKKDYRVWADFWKGFRSDFGQSLFCGLLFALVYYLTGVSILYYINVMRSSWAGLALIIVFAFLIAIPIMMSLYCFSLIATVELSLFGIIKNAFALSFLNFRKNLVSLLIFVAALGLTGRYSPFSLGVYILPVIPFLRLVDLYLQFPAIEKYVATKN
jgi:uncharacterized membrane protein YesL